MADWQMRGSRALAAADKDATTLYDQLLLRDPGSSGGTGRQPAVIVSVDPVIEARASMSPSQRQRRLGVTRSLASPPGCCCCGRRGAPSFISPHGAVAMGAIGAFRRRIDRQQYAVDARR